MRRFLRQRRGQALWNKDSTGQAYIELIMVLPIVLILLAGVLFFGRVLYLKIALDMASYDGARAAVEALEEGAGISQGVIAAQNTLAGFHVNWAAAQIEVVPVGPWQRGAQVYCRIGFNLDVSDVPFIGRIWGGGLSIPMQSVAWSRVETLRSEW